MSDTEATSSERRIYFGLPFLFGSVDVESGKFSVCRYGSNENKNGRIKLCTFNYLDERHYISSDSGNVSFSLFLFLV